MFIGRKAPRKIIRTREGRKEEDWDGAGWDGEKEGEGGGGEVQARARARVGHVVKSRNSTLTG